VHERDIISFTKLLEKTFIGLTGQILFLVANRFLRKLCVIKQVAPGELEAVLLKHPRILDVAVVP